MERSTSWTFLVILVISLCHFQTSETCSCFYRHPQDHFCNSDFFGVVNVLIIWRGNYSETVFVNVHEIFRATGGTLNDTLKKNIIALSSDTMCGRLNLTSGEKWVLGGRMIHDKLYTSPCGFAQRWSEVTSPQRENFRYFYHLGCECQIWDNVRPYNSNFESPGRMTCVLNNSIVQRFCQDRYSVCTTNSSTGCFWMPSDAYNKCAAGDVGSSDDDDYNNLETSE